MSVIGSITGVPEEDLYQKPGHIVESHAIAGQHGEGGEKTEIQHHNHRQEFAKCFRLS